MNMKRYTGILVLALVMFAAALATAQPQLIKNYFSPCNTIGAGCDNVLNITGTVTATSAATLNGFVSGVSNATYKVARGTVTLDGSNPSSATTGLATIVACTVVDKRSTAPGLDPTAFTIATQAVAGRLDVYAWKPTAVADTTLIASTDADDTIDYVCIGT